MTQKDFTSPPNGKSTPQGSTDNVLRQAKEAASHLVTEAKGEMSSRAASQKDLAAERLEGVAHALRGTREELDEKAPGFAPYADKAADAVEQVSQLIRSRDLGDVIHGVERFARREPALFLGGAVVLGLVAGRFLRSSPAAHAGGYEGGNREDYSSRNYESNYAQGRNDRYDDGGNTDYRPARNYGPGFEPDDSGET